MASSRRRVTQASQNLPGILRDLSAMDTMLLMMNWTFWSRFAERKMHQHVARLGPMPDRLSSLAGGPPRSIWLLRQGYLQPSDQVRLIADMLQRQGHIVIMTRSRGGVNTETVAEVLEDNTELLAAVAAEANTDDLPIGMIGFSKGGCDLVYMGHHLMMTHRIVPRWFTTVSSPLQGSRVARWADHPGGQELMCGSEATLRRVRILAWLESQGMQSMPWCVRGDQVTRRKHSRAQWQRAQDLPKAWSHWGAAQNVTSMSEVAKLVDEWVTYFAQGIEEFDSM